MKNYVVLGLVIMSIACIYALEPGSPGGWEGSPAEARMRAQDEYRLRRQIAQQHRPRGLFRPAILTNVELLIRGADAQSWEMDHFLNMANPAQINVLNRFGSDMRSRVKTQLNAREKAIFAEFPVFVQDVLQEQMFAPEQEIDATVIDTSDQ